mmetsp:Transcript_50675/g.120681  ORF Transcript_50675/g.120681 Transcript_50675/m.120681 type:complete len:225 (-) Transcript_50675:87-761(-)
MEEKRVTSFASVLDAGCGTGLVGPLLRNISTHLAGLDISPEMVKQAEARAVYDSLEVGEIVEGLGKYTKNLDLVVAADVFVYFGALEAVFEATSLALRKGAWFAFTLERLHQTQDATPEGISSGDKKGESKPDQPLIVVASEKQVPGGAEGEGAAPAREYTVSDSDVERGWKLQLTGRFAHTREYVEKLSREHNFKVMQHAEIVPRSDNGKDIQGHLFVLQATR